jgi:hypothetical protein
MDSPLTQQLRPDIFEPKIVQLYLFLFNVLANDDDLENATPSEGFWREFFLLKPDKQRLFEIIQPMTAGELLHIHARAFPNALVLALTMKAANYSDIFSNVDLGGGFWNLSAE